MSQKHKPSDSFKLKPGDLVRPNPVWSSIGLSQEREPTNGAWSTWLTKTNVGVVLACLEPVSSGIYRRDVFLLANETVGWCREVDLEKCG
jgi:hypothetical protein